MRNATHSNQTECGTEILYCVPSVPVRLPPSITMVTIVVVFSYSVVDFCCLRHIHLRMAPLVEIATLEADLTLPISVCHPPDAALGLDFHLFVTMKSGGK